MIEYKDGIFYKNARKTYLVSKTLSTFKIKYPSGKLVAEFKLKKSLFGKSTAILGNLKIEKEKNAPIADAKIVNRNINLIENDGNIALIRGRDFLANFDFDKNTLDIYEDEGLCVVIFTVLKNL